MRLTAPPASATWHHHGARTGYEIAFVVAEEAGHRLTGHTTAHEPSGPWSVGYDVTVDEGWRTVTVHAAGGQPTASCCQGLMGESTSTSSRQP